MFPVDVLPDVFDSACAFIVCSHQSLQLRFLILYSLDGLLKFRMCFSRFLELSKTDFIFPDYGADFRIIKLPTVIMIVQRAFWKVL